MLSVHRAVGTWNRSVDVYVALTEFARAKFIEGGLPADRVVVKPNFVDDPGVGAHDGRYALFVGRLVPEKGLDVLLDAWDRVQERAQGARLKIVGTGPLERLNPPRAGIEWLGWQSPCDVRSLMQKASFLVFPSRTYEGFPMAIVESLATGLPVVATRIGSVAELIRDGQTGILCRVGMPEDFADAIVGLFTDDERRSRLGRNARREYEAKYTTDRNYKQLLGIYELASEYRFQSSKGGRS
jgi:glycosyltransferase involved in cell wall biosynthesis